MTTNNVLVVTNYFPPEKGAASNRMYAMAQGLAERGMKVHVVCPLPNYPKGSVFSEYRGKLYSKTRSESLKVHRLWLWPSNSGNKLIRLISMVSFAWSLALFFIFKKTPKKVIVQYSPVFVGFTAVFFGWLFRKKIIVNVSDLWPLAGLEMGLLQKGMYYSLLEKMERFCYKKAHLILGQSNEILDHITEIGIKKELSLYRNYPQFEPPILHTKSFSGEIRIVYAGLLGVAQGMYHICQSIELPDNISLHIYGSGPEAALISALDKKNIEYHGEIARELLHKELLDYDVVFIPLVNRIYGSVPSKIFEYTRLGLPVLYFAGGEGEDIVTRYSLGWSIPVSNTQLLQKFMDVLSEESLVAYPRKDVQQQALEHFNFERQFSSFYKKLEAL